MSKGFGSVQRKIAEIRRRASMMRFGSTNFAGKFTANIGLRKSSGYLSSGRLKHW
jgi:hypothetical protein